MNNIHVARSQLRTYKLARTGHFEAAHYLPDYPGKCATLHGHRWEVTAIVEFPIIPREMVSHDDPDACGMLVDFHDLDELWAEYDHPPYGALNEVIPNPTAEVISNILLEALCDLVEESLGSFDLPFNATIILNEGPDSCVEVSVYRPALAFTQEERELSAAIPSPWTDWLRGDIEREEAEERECNCPNCLGRRAEELEARTHLAHLAVADTVTSL